MDKSQKYALKMESLLKQLDGDLEKLAAAGNTRTGEALAAYHAVMRALRAERDNAYAIFGQMRVATAEAARKLESKMRVSWTTIEQALAKANADFANS